MNSRFVIALLVAMLAPTLSSATEVVPVVTIDRNAIRLSESVRITLSLDGATPLRVDLPKELLDELSTKSWRIRPQSAAVVEDQPNGQQRWSQSFRVDPYVPGEAVHLGFAAVNVQAGTDREPKTISWKSLEVRVTTTVKGDAISEMRGGTGIELLPELTDSPRAFPPWLLGTFLAALAVMAVVAWIGRRTWYRQTAISVEQQALTNLDNIPDGSTPADILRQYIEARTGLALLHLTTPELLQCLQPRSLPDLQAVLERCDLAKFAGVTADNTSDRIVGVQPNPAASTSPIFARGTDIYYSIETPQGDTNVLCAEHPTSFALRICDFIIQVAYGNGP